MFRKDTLKAQLKLEYDICLQEMVTTSSSVVPTYPLTHTGVLIYISFQLKLSLSDGIITTVISSCIAGNVSFKFLGLFFEEFRGSGGLSKCYKC